MIKKIDIINDAYSMARISGKTSKPTPDDIQDALVQLDSMALEWQDTKNLCTGYEVGEDSNPDDTINIQPYMRGAFSSNLSKRMHFFFGKDVPRDLLVLANQTLSGLSSKLALVRPLQYPHRMPRGSGNQRYNLWRRFYRTNNGAPLNCDTQNAIVGDINDYVESWDAYLDVDEVISSYTLEASETLTIVSQSFDNTQVNYRVRVDEFPASVKNVFVSVARVVIVVTTSTGRVNTRSINFQIKKEPEVI